MAKKNISQMLRDKREAPLRNQLDESNRQLQAIRAQQVAQNAARPGVVVMAQSAQEKKAGVSAPYYEGVRDKEGKLLEQYKLDPYAGEASQKLKAEAFGTEMSPWAKMKLEQQGFEETQGRGQLAKSQAQAQAQAQAGMMRQGGLGGGARALLASRGAKDLMMGQQQLAGQGTSQRLGIQSEDLGRKQGLMGDFAQREGQTQEGNINQMKSDVERRAAFEGQRYGKQMEAYGAAQTAAAQRASAPKGKK